MMTGGMAMMTMMTFERLEELLERVKQLARGIITPAELRTMTSAEEFMVVAVVVAAVGAFDEEFAAVANANANEMMTAGA